MGRFFYYDTEILWGNRILFTRCKQLFKTGKKICLIVLLSADSHGTQNGGKYINRGSKWFYYSVTLKIQNRGGGGKQFYGIAFEEEQELQYAFNKLKIMGIGVHSMRVAFSHSRTILV